MGNGKNSKDKYWKIGEKEVWKRVVCGPVGMGTKYEDLFASLVNVHQRASITEEIFNNQADKVTWPSQQSASVTGCPSFDTIGS